MTRVDLFATIHKAIRALLFDTTAVVGRTDFESGEEATAAAAAAERLVAFVHEHADHEDEKVLPALAAHAPELARRLAADHGMFSRLEREVLEAAAAVRSAPSPETGRALQRALTTMTAAQLPHMDLEEAEVNAALWAACDDEELGRIHAAILGSIPPPRMLEWLAVILPAVNVGERAGMLAGARQSAPPEAFQVIAGVAERALGASAWSEVRARVGIA